jgi:hypothetical protein
MQFRAGSGVVLGQEERNRCKGRGIDCVSFRVLE